MSLWSPGEKPRNNLTSSLDIPTPQTDQCTHRALSLYFERVCLFCFRVCVCVCVCVCVYVCVCVCVCICVCVYPALINRTWRHFGSETQLLKDTHPLVRESFEGTQSFTRKDTFCRFCILRFSIGWTGTTVYVCELFVSWEGGDQVEKGALWCLLAPLSFTFCCVSISK
jgi:hypothetical protein